MERIMNAPLQLKSRALLALNKTTSLNDHIIPLRQNLNPSFLTSAIADCRRINNKATLAGACIRARCLIPAA